MLVWKYLRDWNESLTLVVLTLVLLTVLPLSAHVSNEENDGEHQTKTSNNDIADSKEVVLPSKHIGGWENEVLAALEWADIEVVDNREEIVSFKRLFDFGIKFSEVGKTSSSHPNDESIYNTQWD